MPTMPTMSRFPGVILATVLIALVSGCSRDGGPAHLETRDVTEFHGIDIEGGSSLEISVGSPQRVQVEAPQRVLDQIRTEVRDGILIVRSRGRHWVVGGAGSRITIRIAVPKLESLRLTGGHRASIDGFAGGESRIDVEGAVKLHASGQLDQLTVRLAGAGTADLSELTATTAQVTVDGVGRVIVHSTDTLDATMNGLGAIHYIGTPREVRTRMNGLGSIGRQDSAEEDAPVELDPEKLQPEYDERDEWKKGGETEVI
jgi:preprotein translocase subunit SecD